MSYFSVYLILILDNISMTLTVIAIILSVMLIIALVILLSAYEDGGIGEFPIKNTTKIFIPLYLLITLTAIFCPNTKQAATIYLLPKIANNKSMQKLPSRAANLLLLEVKKEMDSLNDGVKK